MEYSNIRSIVMKSVILSVKSNNGIFKYSLYFYENCDIACEELYSNIRSIVMETGFH